MKIRQHPIPATILLGLISAVAFMPLSMILNTVVVRWSAICLTLWLFAGGYAFLLGHWSRTGYRPVGFAVLVLLTAIFLVKSIAAFLLLTLVFISWIRSGVCFQKSGGISLAVELALCVAGGAMVAVCAPVSPLGWALAVWMFFLLQALYFVIIDIQDAEPHDNGEIEEDPFERACTQAENILAREAK
jgi:hypothetical protein